MANRRTGGAPLPVSPEFRLVLDEARDIARATGQRFCSAHVLLALFTVPNRAQGLLRDQEVDEDVILALIRSVEGEGAEAVNELKARSREMAEGLGARQVDCLHLLLAMSRVKATLAYDLLLRTGVSIAELRNLAMAQSVGGVPRRRPVASQTTREGPSVSPVSEMRRGPGPTTAPTRPPKVEVGVEDEPEDDLLRGTDVDRRLDRLDDNALLEARAEAPPVDDEAIEARRPAPTQAPMVDEALYELDPSEFPWLTSLGRNLTLAAAQGRIDPLVGRDRQLTEIIDVMGKRRANNPCLVGKPGVGKTAIVEGLARYLVDGEGVPPSLRERVIVELDVGALLAGTQLRGSLSEKVRGLREEVSRAERRVIVFIDELHAVVGAGSGGDGSPGVSGELKTALARGEFPCIGATTEDEYHRQIAADPALNRRFQPIEVPEPTPDEARVILRGVVDRYEEHHEVRYRDEALDACVRLADRYIRDRHLPDKALGVLDLAGSRAARKGLTDVTADMVARVVADITGVPEERLLLSDTERLLRMEQELGRNIIGHRHVLTRIADVIRRNYAGFAGQRPMGSFLFLGPSGVGKTETARALASYLFGTDEAVTRIDMAEYSEAHAVARFVGAPPGYVGHEEGGQLTEAVRRRPFHIVLLDEIEKAHRDVLQLLLQVLDEGRLTDGRGRVVQFSNTVVILTSNLGGQAIFDTMDSQTGGIGFASGARRRAGAAGEEDPGADEALIEAALEAAERSLVPELWNRIEERLVFLPLKRHEIEQIARLLLARTAERLRAERGVQLEADDAVIDALIAGGGFNARLGARPMRQTIQRLVEAPLAERILAGDVTSGDVVHARVEDGAIVFTRAS